MTNDKQRRRLVIFLGFLGLVVLLLIARLAQLMLLRSGATERGGITLPAVERGPILDRNGHVLAITTRLYSVTAWLPEVSDPEGSAALLAETLELDAGQTARRLKEATGFLFVKRKVTPTQSERVRALQAEGRLKGIDLVPEFGRNYPNQSLASHVLGYVGLDNVGLDGVEYSFNEELSPAAVGRADAPQEEIFGNQVFLSIDRDIQHLVERRARQAFTDNQADAVLILAMEAGSAEILGYAAVPDFDPNQFNSFARSTLRNLPLAQAYEPGSVFKIFSIASFLQLGGLQPEEQFHCSGLYEKRLADGETIRIRDLTAHGWVNAGLILKYSCNVGAAYASEKVQREDFYRLLQSFGFGRPTGLPLPGESAGILAPPARWSLRTKATIAFGQEISVSALQVMQAATAIANGGLLLAPRIVTKILSPTGELVKEFGREPLREVVSPQVAREVLEMMAAATGEAGTARRGSVEGVRISAKTGTAQVRDPATGTYSESNYVASYLGIFPTEEPRIILYVVLHNPKGPAYYGSQIAAPVFRGVAEDLIGYLGIPRRGDVVLEQPGSLRVTVPPALVLGERMPDLRGTPKRLLLPLLAVPGLEVRISGDGFVAEQDPPAGTPLQAGASIRLRLE